MKLTDAVVIGAGPGGTAVSSFLAREGLRVTLLDQAKFPRDKVCGEFISPAADSILYDMGVLNELDKTRPQRLNGVFISAYEKEELAVSYPPMPGGPKAPTSLSLPRMVLDNLMINQASTSGAEILEKHRVDDFIFDGDRVAGVKGRGPDGRPFKLGARIIIDAGGRNALSLRRFSLKRVSPGGRVALAAHWGGAEKVGEYCYMHVSSPGYTGIAKTGNSQVNVILVVESQLVQARRIEEFYRETVFKNSKRTELLEGAEPIEPVRVVESLAFDTIPPPCEGLIMVGDAMGFIDPFTGEGIYLALRSARIAADVIISALEENDISRHRLMEYFVARKREFGRKFLLSRILQGLLCRPVLCRKTIALLSKKPELAGELVGVIGDYLNPRTTVSLSYLFRLLLAPAEGTSRGNGHEFVRREVE